jgi:hypothetical protein
LFLQSKYEFQAKLPFKNSTISIGSINNHGEIFYDRFEIKSGNPGLRFSGCVGWGYERILFAILAQKGVDFSTSYYKKLFSDELSGSENRKNMKSDLKCNRCLKTVDEDSKLNGPGLVKTVTNQGQEEYICHVCYKGF